MVQDNRNSLTGHRVDFYSYKMGVIMSATQDLWKDWRACKLRFHSWEHTVVTGCDFLSALSMLPVADAHWLKLATTFVVISVLSLSCRL